MRELADFFAFVNERERIRVRKELGMGRETWTDDPILREYRFCNVFREDDSTTRFFRETVREPLRNRPEVLIATIGWRWFNRIETCQRITREEWAMADTSAMRVPLSDANPVVTGAYVIKTPNGMSKLEGVLNCIDGAAAFIKAFHLAEWMVHDRTLEMAHEQLMRIPYLGRFMAYEVVSDLRHTYLLRNADDIMTWASAGPGCCRGLGWVLEGNPDLLKYGSRKTQEVALDLMRTILAQSLLYWDFPERPWEMREVEHCLCEYDKYRRAQGGQRLKRRYTP